MATAMAMMKSNSMGSDSDDSVLILYQKIAASSDDCSPIDDLTSPPYSPTPSVSERPALSSRVESQLRRACAIVVEETNPASHGSDDLFDHNEPLRRYIEQCNARNDAIQTRIAKPEPQLASSSRRLRESESRRASKPLPYTHVPRNAASSFEATAGHQNQSAARDGDDAMVNPLDFARTKPSGKTRDHPPRPDQQCALGRAALDARPQTSAGPCIDSTGPSAGTSSSVSRSTTTHDGSGRPTSTGLTSMTSPGSIKKSSPASQRVSEQIRHNGPAASLADATAKAWMAQELSRRRGSESHTGRHGRPSTRASEPARYADSDRPMTRTGSIAESVKLGLRDYIRPRASSDSMRSTRSESHLSKANGRDGKDHRGSGNNWWRGSSVQNKRSWASFGTTKADRHHDACPADQDREPNLNRALPALPGLDQYKEKKAGPTHVAQLMKPARAGEENRMKAPTAVAMPDNSYQEFIAAAKRQKQLADSKKVIEERMRRHAMMASSTFGSRPPQPQQDDRPERPKTNPPHPTTTVNTTTAAASNLLPNAPVKKPGLRKRLSRFWSHGGERGGMDGTNKRYGSLVAAN